MRYWAKRIKNPRNQVYYINFHTSTLIFLSQLRLLEHWYLLKIAFVTQLMAIIRANVFTLDSIV